MSNSILWMPAQTQIQSSKTFISRSLDRMFLVASYQARYTHSQSLFRR